MKNIPNSLYVHDRREWREWLEKNHNIEKELWLIFYKKCMGKTGISYDEAVEEALCFGWIDSIIKSIDDECFVRKFTPRTDTAKWSEINIRRINKLIAEGRMTGVGMEKIDTGVLDGTIKPVTPPSLNDWHISPEIEAALSADAEVWKNFTNLPPSYRQNYIRWITSAKKEETRQRRLKEAIQLLARNEKLGLK